MKKEKKANTTGCGMHHTGGLFALEILSMPRVQQQQQQSTTQHPDAVAIYLQSKEGSQAFQHAATMRGLASWSCMQCCKRLGLIAAPQHPIPSWALHAPSPRNMHCGQARPWLLPWFTRHGTLALQGFLQARDAVARRAVGVCTQILIKSWQHALTLHGLLHHAADALGRRVVDARVRALQADSPAGLRLLAVQLRVELLERRKRERARRGEVRARLPLLDVLQRAARGRARGLQVRVCCAGGLATSEHAIPAGGCERHGSTYLQGTNLQPFLNSCAPALDRGACSTQGELYGGRTALNRGQGLFALLHTRLKRLGGSAAHTG